MALVVAQFGSGMKKPADQVSLVGGLVTLPFGPNYTFEANASSGCSEGGVG